MSHHETISRRSVVDITAQKGGAPIVVLTCYSAPYAALLDPHVDMLLVGDSLGMVLYGLENTLPVTLDMMIAHGRAVAHHSKRACVVVDMPFGSYQASKEQAFTSAARVLSETGCQAIKLEGGHEMVETVSFLVERGIPVMGHVGLKPQHVNRMGGYKYQGRTEDAVKQIVSEAHALQEAGAFSLVVEGSTEPLAARLSRELTIPTIGIGASPACDGQVLVTDDMLGLFEQTPRFVKQFGTIRSHIEDAAKQYADAVRQRTFPAVEHCFTPKRSS